TVQDLPIEPGALYLLAAKPTPTDFVATVIEVAKEGTVITQSKAKQLLATYKEVHPTPSEAERKFLRNSMVQRKLDKDKKTQWRERQRRHRKNKKPYFAKRAALRAQLEDPAVQALKAVQGVYDVVIVDPPWPVAFQHREE